MKSDMRLLLTIAIVTSASGFAQTLPADPAPPGAVVRSDRPLMGSSFSISVWAPSGKQPEAAVAINDALDRIEALERTISSWDPDSETSLLNAQAGGGPIKVSKKLRELISRSLEWSEKTGGAFDVTGGPLFTLYDEARRTSTFPSEAALQQCRFLVGPEKVCVSGRGVALALPGMKLSFGGIGKGYAADEAGRLIQKRGFENYLIDAGGDLLVRGARGERPWEIAIRHPRSEKYLAYTSFTDCAVATSGDYERYFVVGGERYSHIVDPRTGLPSAGPASVTVLADNCTDADALATAVSVLGQEQGPALVNSLPGVEAVLINANGVTILSSGLRIAEERLQWKR